MLQLTDLDPAQAAAVDRLYEHDETLLIAGLGFGKCAVGMTALAELLRDGAITRALVLAPKRVCELTWAEEAAKWAHLDEHDVAVAVGPAAQRAAAMASPARIVVCNFENTGWAVDNYGDTFDALLIDEITKLKAVGGAAYRRLRNWVKGLTWRAGMSGNPAGEAGEDLYGQALLLDLGKALGTRKQAFLEQYMVPQDWEQRRWDWLPGGLERAVARLGALIYKANDQGYLDSLPPVQTTLVPVDMSAAARDAYRAIERVGVLKDEAGEVRVVAPTAAQVQMKLQQIACGGLYGEDTVLVDEWAHKIKALAPITLTLQEPVVIVYQFQFELSWLRVVFPRAPILGKGTPFTAGQQAAWNRGEVPVLLMHPRSAAHGLNLQGACRTIIHLGPLWGADPWAQCLGRLRRRGQRAPAVIRYVLVSRGTVEEDMLDRLDLKAEREALFMEEVSDAV